MVEEMLSDYDSAYGLRYFNTAGADPEGELGDVTERRAGDPAVLVADSHKVRRELRWKPRFEDLGTIVEHAWEWGSESMARFGEVRSLLIIQAGKQNNNSVVNVSPYRGGKNP